jgi:hypothetical protein
MIDNPVPPLEVEDLPELFGDDDFAAQDASLEAVARLKSKGIDVFYIDSYLKVHVLEKPNGDRFEIRYTGKPKADFEIVRELSRLNAT